jgi:hypothetical protein
MKTTFSFKKITLVIAAVLAAQISGCATTTSDSVAGVSRSQFMVLPASYVSDMSNQAYAETLTTAKK